MKIRRRQTPDRSHTPCWFPNRHRATRRPVSNPDCAGDARPHSHPEQYPLSAAPSLLAENLHCGLAHLQALSRPMPGKRLTCEAVTNSRLCTDQRRSRRVRLNLLTQVRNVNAQVLPVLFGFRAPDFAQDVAMRENPSGMLHEQTEQGVLGSA